MKRIFWKISFTYLFALLLVNFLRVGFIDEIFLSRIPILFLLIINILLFLIGIPIPLVLDFLLINHYEINYFLLFPIIIGFISSLHVFLFRKNNLQFLLWDSLLKKGKKIKWISNVNINLNASKIFLIRALPLFPFLFGNYIISSSKLSISRIFILNLLGSYFYYLSLYLLIKSNILVDF